MRRQRPEWPHQEEARGRCSRRLWPTVPAWKRTRRGKRPPRRTKMGSELPTRKDVTGAPTPLPRSHPRLSVFLPVCRAHPTAAGSRVRAHAQRLPIQGHSQAQRFLGHRSPKPGLGPPPPPRTRHPHSSGKCGRSAVRRQGIPANEGSSTYGERRGTEASCRSIRLKKKLSQEGEKGNSILKNPIMILYFRATGVKCLSR